MDQNRRSRSAGMTGHVGPEYPAEVPEPGSLALFGIAMLGAGMIARKRANKA